jgi:hypothetical protein
MAAFAEGLQETRRRVACDCHDHVHVLGNG